MPPRDWVRVLKQVPDGRLCHNNQGGIAGQTAQAFQRKQDARLQLSALHGQVPTMALEQHRQQHNGTGPGQRLIPDSEHSVRGRIPSANRL